MLIYAKFMKELLSRKKGLPKPVVLTGSYNAIFQGRLPLTKKGPGSFNSIGKLSIKEAQCSLGEGINLIPTLLIEKLEIIEAQPSTVNLTLIEGLIKNSDGVVNDVVVKEESLQQNKTHLMQEFQCHLKRTSTYFIKAKIGAWEHLLLLAKFMEFLPNKRNRKDDVFFPSYMPH